MSKTAGGEFIRYECRDRIATITFNRPEKLNAFNDDMVMQLARALRQFDIDPEADVAVLRGEGRAFSSGADVHQRQLRSEDELKKHGGPQGWGANASELFVKAVNWKPVIAAPHGFAVGLGLGIVLESELIVAEEDTRFQVTETSRGLASSRYWALLNFRGAGSFATEVTHHRPVLHCRRSAGCGRRGPRRGQGRAFATGLRAGARHRRESAIERAGHGAHAPLVHGPGRARGLPADDAAQAAPDGRL